MTRLAAQAYRSPLVSASLRAYFEDLPKGDIYLEEAEFGLRRITPHLVALPPGARVLEVGSGPCIMLAEITERFPHLTVQGIEPMSDGFAFFADFLNRVQQTRAGMNINKGGYEDFSVQGNWALIFLINVFEHLPEWRDFLRFVARSLAPGGHCVILCPNYGFPYESHFKLPILWNKRVTGAVFRHRIERFERERDYGGLYRSLNFVKLRQVRRAARATALDLAVDTGIVCEMIDRLDTNPAFRERQKALALPARLLRRTGLLGALLKLRAVQDVLPYMQITLTRAA